MFPPFRRPRQGRRVHFTDALTPKQRLRSDLRAMLIDGIFFSVMVGMGESMFAAFVLDLGLGPVVAGLVLTVPLLIASLVQLKVPWLVRRSGTYRFWFTLGGSIQAAAFVPLIFAALLAQPVRSFFGPVLDATEGVPRFAAWHTLFTALPAVFIFLIASAYWIGSMGGGPPWVALTGIIVPKKVRPRYFAMRNRMLQAGVLLGLFVGGGLLYLFERLEESLAKDGWNSLYFDPTLTGFAIIFTIACVCRSISAYNLSRYSEPSPLPYRERRVAPSVFFSRLLYASDGRLVLYAMAVSVTVQIAQPFFVPFMREQLHVNGTWLALLLAGSFVGKMICFPFAGSLAQKFGPRFVLRIGGFGIVPVSAFWLFTDNLTALLLLQVLSGALWAFYELGLFLMYYDAIKPEERTSVLALFNGANSLFIMTGSLIGGWLLRAEGSNYAAFQFIFVLSLGLRALTLVLMFRVKPVASTTDVITPEPLSVRAGSGGDDSPRILAGSPVPEARGSPGNA